MGETDLMLKDGNRLAIFEGTFAGIYDAYTIARIVEYWISTNMIRHMTMIIKSLNTTHLTAQLEVLLQPLEPGGGHCETLCLGTIVRCEL